MAASQSLASFRVIPDLLQGATSGPTPARPGRTNRTVRSTSSSTIGAARHRCRLRAGTPPGPRDRQRRQARAARCDVGGDAGEGVTAGELGTSEPGALVAEHQRDPSRTPGRLGCERLGVERPRDGAGPGRTFPPPSCSRRRPPRACRRAALRRARPRRRRPASGPARRPGSTAGEPRSTRSARSSSAPGQRRRGSPACAGGRGRSGPAWAWEGGRYRRRASNGGSALPVPRARPARVVSARRC